MARTKTAEATTLAERTVEGQGPQLPGRMTPAARNVISGAPRGEALTLTARPSEIILTVSAIKGASPAPWPVANGPGPQFRPHLERSADGVNWMIVEPVTEEPITKVGEYRNTHAASWFSPGDQLRVVEAFVGVESSVTYSVEVR